MKRHLFWRTLLSPPKLRRSDILLTVVPALLWFAAVYARPWVIEARCVKDPEYCSEGSVLAMDRYALGRNSARADEYSYLTQNASGALALVVPLALSASDVLLRSVPIAAAAGAVGVDLVIWAQTVSWNGFLNESARLLVQRPRPFVYSDVANLGKNPANYTSFYSGHTSFSAASCTALLLILLARNASLLTIVIAGAGGQALIMLTGFFRVLAGRHFVTDVLVGATAGYLVALLVAYLHRDRARTDKDAPSLVP